MKYVKFYAENIQKVNINKYMIKVYASGWLVIRNRRLLRPIKTYKDAISKPSTKADTETNAKDKAPTTSQPQCSDRVAKRNKSRAELRRAA